MAKHTPISLQQRQQDYDAAEAAVVQLAERYVEARAGGRLTVALMTEMNDAELQLRRAKRRLEKTQHRLAA